MSCYFKETFIQAIHTFPNIVRIYQQEKSLIATLNSKSAGKKNIVSYM